MASLVAASPNASVGNIYAYCPSELPDSDRQYPLVMVVNDNQSPAKTYLPFFERLASSGFVVIGNDDPQPGTGEPASETLGCVLNESEIGGGVDRSAMGIVGYSQGGAGAINAVTKFENGGLYRALFTSSAAYPLLAMTREGPWPLRRGRTRGHATAYGRIHDRLDAVFVIGERPREAVMTLTRLTKPSVPVESMARGLRRPGRSRGP